MICAFFPEGKYQMTGKTNCLAAAVLLATAPALRSATHPGLVKSYGKVPLSFEENRGQAAAGVRYLSRTHGGTVLLRSGSAALQSAAGETITMRFVGSASAAMPVGEQKLVGRTSYLVGSERDWIRDVPNYASVRYESVYPGIDAVFHGNQKQLEYDFVLNAGADPNRIRLAFDGVARIDVDAAGNLELIGPHGTVKQLRPVIWQDGPAGRREVAGRYVLAGTAEARFQVDEYDRREPLVIDPVIQYSTYFGSAGDDQANAIAADSNGNVYVAGNMVSGGVLWGFASKLNPTGTAVLYTAYFGSGSCNADARGIAIDSGGNAIVTGYYTSLDQWGYCNVKQVLGAKINPAGNAFVFQVVWGGSEDYGNGVAVDAAGNSYYTGSTDGNLLTTAGVIFTGGGFPGDAFITKLNPSGGVVYSTYLGGGLIDEGLGITVDSGGNAYVVGTAGSNNFPVTANAVQPTMHNPDVTGFVTEVNSTATQILYSTFLGGNYGESADDVKVDSQGKIHVIGTTNSSDFPTTANAFDRSCGTDGACNPYYDGIWHYSEDLFYTKIDRTKAGAAGLMYSTYLGGTNRELAGAIAVDSNNRAWITGRTASIADFPTVAPTQATLGGDYDAYVVEIDPAQSEATSLVFSTFLGGGAYDEGTGIAIDTLGDIYIAGFTASTNFPVRSALQPNTAGGNDAFIVKFGNPAAGTLASVAVNPATVTGGTNSTGTVTLSSAAGAGGATVTLSSNVGAAIVPTTVQVAVGQTSATFTITTAAVAAATNATITATYNGESKTATLTINPAAAALSAVSVNPTSVTGGTASTGTVTLTAAAPAGGAVVTLSSSSASAIVPASVTVAANAKTATFRVTTKSVTTAATATITTAYSGVSKTAALTVSPAAVSTLTANPASVTGGTNSTGTVTLTGPAPAGGAVVVLSSSNTTAATVPASVTVAANATSATFVITGKTVPAAATATITATYSGTSKTASLAIKPAALSSVSLNPGSVNGVSKSTGTATLTGAAPAGGVVVTLSSSNTAAATVPASVTVAATATTATFTVTPGAVTAATSVTITATFGGVSKTATVTVNPVALSTVSLSPATVTGGTNSTGTVTLNGSAPTGGTVVTLSSSNTAAATVPASVKVAAGATTATFTATSKAASAATSVTVTATYNGVSKTAALTVNPPAMSSVTVSPSTVKGGTANSTGTITLTGPAPTGGAVVTLASSNTGAATVPASVTVAANSKTATFTITTKTVTATTSVTITSTYKGVSKAGTLTVN
jgi:hypothetical protein